MLIIHLYTNKKDSPISMVTDRHACEVVTPVLTQVMRVSCPGLKLKILGWLAFVVHLPNYNPLSPYSWIFVQLMDRIIFNFLINFGCLVTLNGKICNTVEHQLYMPPHFSILRNNTSTQHPMMEMWRKKITLLYTRRVSKEQ